MTSRKGTQMLEKDIKKVLFSQEDIVAKTKELGQQLTEDYAGKNPLLVCVLKGRTLLYLRDMFKYRKANSVKIATLFDKPEGRVVDIEADYVCYDVPNEFIVGFGLDYDEKYRNLPYVGVLKEEIYTK